MPRIKTLNPVTNTDVVTTPNAIAPPISLKDIKTASNSDLANTIKERRNQLTVIGSELKRHFVGLDGIIDSIMKKIELWYVMPSLVNSPCIICLWGMTGVGKTDLVRRLVKLLGKQDKFLEMQLSNKGTVNSFQGTTMENVLRGSSLKERDAGVLLLDEIQRFRTVESDGSEIHDYKYQDIWMLLSDGKFATSSINRKEEIMQMIFDHAFTEDWQNVRDSKLTKKEKREEDKEAEKEANGPQRKFQSGYYQANRLKKLLKLDEEIEEIATWGQDVTIEKLKAGMADADLCVGSDYSNLLVFISGNLDEAYTEAFATGEADLTADFYHEKTKNIDMLNIKNALRSRFKPEQISRFGNNHILYPSLSEAAYSEIIRRKTSQMCDDFYDNFKIKIEVDESMRNMIYRNGVFPVQGTRPLFSTINSAFYNKLPELILFALENCKKKVKISYRNNTIIGEYTKGETLEIFYKGELDVLRKKRDRFVDMRYNIAVHEAGHAVVQSLLFGVAPTNISCETISAGALGYVMKTQIYDSVETYQKSMTVSVSGTVAERLVFGSDLRSGGAANDLMHATKIAGMMTRIMGLGESSKAFIDFTGSNKAYSIQDYKPTDKEIEAMIRDAFEASEACLTENLGFLKAVVDVLVVDKQIDADRFKEICDEHNLNIDIIKPDEYCIAPYQERYEVFSNTLEVEYEDAPQIGE